MAHDDLNAPLGLAQEDGSKAGAVRTHWKALCGVAAVALAGGGVFWFASGYDGPGGRAQAVASIERFKEPAPAPVAQSPAVDPAPTGSIAKVLAPRTTAADIESASGVRVRRQGADTPGALIISIPETPRVGLSPAPDRRLTERSRFGILPRRGADGAMPYEVYARPLVTSGRLKPSAPRVAIVIGGMGLNPAVTAAAVQKLSADITLAFAPYGEGLDDQVAQAREVGHEIVLQVPMEPFDLAGPGPGPHMLRTAYDRKQMKERLHWHLGRFAGYVGVANFLGAKFTADSQALAAVMQEVGGRGLMYFDDGSSPRSLAATVATASKTPFLQADVILDERRDPRAIDAALARLESLAIQRGSAIGFGNGLPEVVSAVARFAGQLEKRGVLLAPLTALIGVHRPVARAEQ